MFGSLRCLQWHEDEVKVENKEKPSIPLQDVFGEGLRGLLSRHFAVRRTYGTTVLPNLQILT